eukprot:CAMPEP_0170238620 /NCGR_PEP_ID=MMETSP0116_2-20130129/19066_1 /TAXON_ID=400756 /ORGANISM="Durinskia baltica, Strain CSIRO CS-38" /LENGTH=278 /DNA_ID=CAMNT_0010489435 /DNA_START=25 /DNA_END=861 /DNA_ORIENTATION=+
MAELRDAQFGDADKVEQQQYLDRLSGILRRFDVTIAEASDLVILSDYEIAIIVDDSTSMKSSADPVSQRVLGQKPRTRWDEVKATASLLIEIANCFDSSGVDVFFLNRRAALGVKSERDATIVKAFADPPNGPTPLSDCLEQVAARMVGERPVLLFILTDGEPDGGRQTVIGSIRKLLKSDACKRQLRIQIMACTPDESEIAWMNEVDHEFSEVDVTDDYHAEKLEVEQAGRAKRFTRGDWCMKALLGMVSSKFDGWDEKRRITNLAKCNPLDTCVVL